MASKRAMLPVRGLTSALMHSTAKDPLMQCLLPSLYRSMATEASLPSTQQEAEPLSSSSSSSSFLYRTPNYSALARRPPPLAPQILTTIYSFPSMEPLRFAHYAANQLDVPVRRDILHRAVVFEGDAARQGTASTKWRSEVHGSRRKLRRQKGLGAARLGDRKSPMLRGGGVAFGPKPRDFSTDLPRKIYDLAWRTALSYRYRRGELVLIEDGDGDGEGGDGFEDLEMAEPRWVGQIFERNGFGREHGRSMVVTGEVRPNLYAALAGAGEHGLAKTEEDVDVKDLLETGRIIMEKGVLDRLLLAHSSDINRVVRSAVTA